MTIPATLVLSGIVHVPNPGIVEHGSDCDIRIVPRPGGLEASFEVHTGTDWQPLWVIMSRQGEIGDKHHGMLTDPILSLPSHHLMAALLSMLAGRPVAYEAELDAYVLSRYSLMFEKAMRQASDAALRIGLHRQRWAARPKN